MKKYYKSLPYGKSEDEREEEMNELEIEHIAR